MKPFQELSYRGKVRRLRKQAQAALEPYGLSQARFREWSTRWRDQEGEYLIQTLARL